MLACQRIARATLTKSRQFHTLPAVLAEEGGLFGKLNPWAKKQQTQQEQQVTPAQHTSNEQQTVTFNVKYQDADEVTSWKRKDVLENVQEIESTVKSVILQHVEGATEQNWDNLPLDNLETKFKVRL